MTKHPPGSLEALAEVISAQVKGVRPLRPKLTLVPRPTVKKRSLDSVTRDSIYRRVRFLARRYAIEFLIEQATFDMPGLDHLEDSALTALLNDMETARECIEEGISLEDAQLIRRCAPPDLD